MEQLELDLGEPPMKELPADKYEGEALCVSKTEGAVCFYFDTPCAQRGRYPYCSDKAIVWVPKKVLP